MYYLQVGLGVLLVQTPIEMHERFTGSVKGAFQVISSTVKTVCGFPAVEIKLLQKYVNRRFIFHGNVVIERVFSMLSGSLFTTARRVHRFRFRMEATASRYGGSCEYWNKQSQGVKERPSNFRAERGANNSLHKEPSMLRDVAQGFGLGKFP
jgi:hypothetical protein